MVNCRTCQGKTDLDCKSCACLIDGVVLQKRLKIPVPVSVKSAEGETYPGSIFVVSPVGLGIEVSLDASDYYIVKVDETLEIKVSKIRSRGKNCCHGFDIVKVIREEGSSGRLNAAEYSYLIGSPKGLGNQYTAPHNVRDFALERKNREIKKARILEMLQVGQAYNYNNGFFKTVSSGTGDSPLPRHCLEAFANRCSNTGVPCREVIYSDENKIYDIHGIPVGKQNVGVLVLDVTSLVQQEKELRIKQIQVYRQALQAVTGGKFTLEGREKAAGYIPEGEPVIDRMVRSQPDIEHVKNSVKELLVEKCVMSNKIFMVLVCLSEALTNATSHTRRRRCRIFVSSTGITAVVSDTGESGTGFDSAQNSDGQKSFSGSDLLGSGLTYLLKCLDKIIVCTDEEDTVLILEKENLF